MKSEKLRVEDARGEEAELTGSLAERIKNSFPADEYDYDLVRQCFNDLRDRRLIVVDTLTYLVEGENVATAKVTGFGKKFLNFITE